VETDYKKFNMKRKKYSLKNISRELQTSAKYVTTSSV